MSELPVFVTAPNGGGSGISLAGDLGHTAAVPWVVSITGASPIAITPNEFQWVSGATGPLLDQAITASTPAANFTIAPQDSSATDSVGGSLIFNLPGNHGTHAGDTAGGCIKQEIAGAPYAYYGGYVGGGSNYYAMWFGKNITPGLSNFSFLGDNNGALATYLNAPTGGTVVLAINGSAASGLNVQGNNITIWPATFQWDSTVAAPVLTQIAVSGNGQNMRHSAQSSNAANGNGGNLILTGGDLNGSGAAGIVQLAVGAASPSTSLQVGPNGMQFGNSPVTLANTGNTTLTQPQYQNPLLTIGTVTLVGNAVLIFPNVRGIWFVDISAITLGGNTLAFKSGTATSPTISTITTTSTIVMISTTGSNGISINV